MGNDEIRDRVFEMAHMPEENEVIKVEIDGYKMIVTRDNVLIKIEGTWVSLTTLIDASKK